MLWTAIEAAAAARASRSGLWTASGVSIDTRTLQAEDLFVALRGPHLDGHDFVSRALAGGAAAAMVARAPDDVAPNDPRLLHVADTMAGLEGLGRAARARSAARILAVTGSVGKTTLRAMLALMLEGFASTHASAGSLNNHWGVPLSLARLPRACAFGVFEVGMNAPGEIRALGAQIRPHVALVTTIAPVHLEGLGSLAGIARAKAEIFEHLAPGGIGIVPVDAPEAAILEQAAVGAGRVLRVATLDDSPHLARADVALVRFASGLAEIRVEGRTLTVPLAAPGRHMAVNAALALAAAAALGLDLEVAASRLAGFAPLAGRGQRELLALPGGGGLTLIDESYNASPASVAAALGLLAETPAARRIAVLGTMRELGTESAALHAGLAPQVAASADLLLTVGPTADRFADALAPGRLVVQAMRVEAAEAPLLALVRPGDAVLIKGSNSLGLKRLVEALKTHAFGQSAEPSQPAAARR